MLDDFRSSTTHEQALVLGELWVIFCLALYFLEFQSLYRWANEQFTATRAIFKTCNLEHQWAQLFWASVLSCEDCHSLPRSGLYLKHFQRCCEVSAIQADAHLEGVTHLAVSADVYPKVINGFPSRWSVSNGALGYSICGRWGCNIGSSLKYIEHAEVVLGVGFDGGLPESCLDSQILCWCDDNVLLRGVAYKWWSPKNIKALVTFCTEQLFFSVSFWLAPFWFSNCHFLARTHWEATARQQWWQTFGRR